ncbi:MAG: hypothetical protein V3R89_00045, partial [Thermoanaerobaculia bacterium]
IVVLWAAYFVLSTRSPIGRPDGEASRPALQQQGLAVDRLQKSALSRHQATEPLFRPRPAPPTAPPPVTPARRLARPEIDRSQARLERAYDAGVLAPAFARSRLPHGVVQAAGEPSPGLLNSRAQVSASERSEIQPQQLHPDLHNASAGGDPNLLARKDDFLRRARAAERPTYLPSTVQGI